MTTYYVGPGGNDGNDGLSWANRFLTLNGAEDEPVAAGDTVYVGPGVYREMLTVDVSGSGGSPITYIGDVTGENTDGVGGVVRITGSDNDQSATRANCITATTKTHRTFQGFAFDSTTTEIIDLLTGCTDITVTNCVFACGNEYAIYMNGANQANLSLERCILFGPNNLRTIYLFHSSTVDDAGHSIENCVFIAGQSQMRTDKVGGISIKNCVFRHSKAGASVRVGSALTVGQTVDVNNCIFYDNQYGCLATTTGEIVEDYNTFYGNSNDRSNTNTGANSITYPPLFVTPILIDGYKFPWWFGELSEWSQIRNIVGTGTASNDLFGFTRPTIESKKSWGPIQFQDYERETGTTRGSSTASIKLADYGNHQLFVPVANESTTISVYAYREADYSGTAPRMVIKQPGQSDRTTTDAGAAATWNELTDTFTPAADPPYVLVELQSLNVNPSGNFDIFFDDLTVS